jgi:hypothetical protein
MGHCHKTGSRAFSPLEFPQPLHLVQLQAAELRPRAIARRLRHADRTHRIGHRFPLADQQLRLSQLRDDLLRRVRLLGYPALSPSPTLCQHLWRAFATSKPRRQQAVELAVKLVEAIQH